MSSVMALRHFGRQLISRRMSGCLQSSHRWTGLQTGGGGSYEGDGKTTITIIGKDLTGYLLIDAFSNHGFRLSNGLFAFGPIAMFPSTVLQWDIKDVDDINEKSLSMFTLIEPRIEVLVIGVGDDTHQNRVSINLNRKMRSILAEKKINCEIMPTSHAVTTYNFLNVDHRVCAGAFIPPFNPDIDKKYDIWLNAKHFKALSTDETMFT